MRKWTLALLVFLVASAGSARAGVLFQDNVEGGTNGWSAAGLWHLETAGGSCVEAQSGDSSWYYGTGGCNFDVGTSSGALTSPSIVVPADSSIVQLSFWTYYDTEFGLSWDRKFVQVSAGGGPFTTLLQLPGDRMNQWHQWTLDLSAYRGQTIRLQFFFDSIDSVANSGRGWYVDDVLVYASTVPYVFQPTTFDYVDIASPGNLIPSLSEVDDSGRVLPIGFNFNFFGVDHATVGVSSNGFLSFGPDVSSFSNTDIPNLGSPNDYIAPFWDDLYTFGSAASNVYAATVGSSPNRRFVVQYDNVDFFPTPGSGSLDFQVILNEADGSMVFQYRDMLSVNAGRGGGNSATIGIENAGGTDGLRYSFNTESVQNGTAIKIARTILDTDGDGLPDSFEITYGTDPTDPNDPVLTEDVDGDGLNWLEEFQAGTNPLLADTDGDTVSDGDEVFAGTNPLLREPLVIATLAAPGVEFGTAYFEFTAGGGGGSVPTTGYRVFFGAGHGNAIDDYDGFIDLAANQRSGLLYQNEFGLKGVPIVYYRVAPTGTVNGRTYVGNLSNELSTYFAGSEPGKDGSTGDGSTTESDDDDSGGMCFVGALGSLAPWWAGAFGAAAAGLGALGAARRRNRKP